MSAGSVTSVNERRLLGASLQLTVVSSVDWRTTDQPVEHLGDCEAVLLWPVFPA